MGSTSTASIFDGSAMGEPRVFCALPALRDEEARAELETESVPFSRL